MTLFRGILLPGLVSQRILWQVSMWPLLLYTREIENHPMFSVHNAPEKFENASIISYFGFSFEENLSREITRLLCRLHFGSSAKPSFSTSSGFCHRFRWYATLENKTLAKTFPKFPSIIRVIDMSDRNPPITATSVTFYLLQLLFRDGLVWTVQPNWEIKLRFEILPA